jgi:signal peptidase I
MSEPAIALDPPKKQKGIVQDYAEFLLKLGLFVFVLRSFIFAPFSIPSESMLPRLFVGDYLIVTKWNYGYSKHSLPWSVPLIPGRIFASVPDRGDVVVFKTPADDSTDLIKRVIGVPGDVVQMRGGTLWLNGKPISKVRLPDFVQAVTPNTVCLPKSEPARADLPPPPSQETASDGTIRCRYARFRETLPGGKSYDVLDFGSTFPDNTQPYTVPAGHIFMMGDDRDNSGDSRFEAGGFGFVRVENIVGKAQFTVFSTDGSAHYLLPWTWFTAARWGRIGEGF